MAALEMSSAIMEVTELSSTIMKTLEVPPRHHGGQGLSSTIMEVLEG